VNNFVEVVAPTYLLEERMSKGLTFRNSKIIYYGPHECEHCGVMICKAAVEQGGSSFTYPSGPIYPNTEWHVHFCDMQDVERWESFKGIPKAAKSSAGAKG
jgi:hypothetical protein